jgi:hypothetical protein
MIFIKLGKKIVFLSLIYFVIYKVILSSMLNDQHELELIFWNIFKYANICALAIYLLPSILLYETLVKAAEIERKRQK